MADIELRGTVGWDFTAESVRDELKKFNGQEEVHVYISSPGGYVFEGLDIYNEFKNFPGNIVFEIGAMCFSSASFIVLAGKDRWGYRNSVYMKHRVTGWGEGNADEFRKEAEILDGMDGIIIDLYSRSFGTNAEQERKDINNETWLFGGDALLNAGVITDIIDDDVDEDGAVKDFSSENTNKFKALLEQSNSKIKDRYLNEFNSRYENFLNNDYTKKANFINNKHTENIENNISDAKGVEMDLQSLKNEHPAVYAEAMQIGKDASTKSEKDRVNTWLEFLDVSPEDVKKGIASGEEITMHQIAKFSKMIAGANSLQNLRSDSVGDLNPEDGNKPDGDENKEIPEGATEFRNEIKGRYKGVK